MTYGTYGYCVYHEIECDYSGSCRDCSHNTEEDTEWFEQDEERAETEVSKPEVKLPKCGSTESSSAIDEANIELLDELYDENIKLRKKLKKARKEKKRWKRKYLGLKAETRPLDFSTPKKVVGEEEIKITW